MDEKISVGDRKREGIYYTPRYIVEFIIKHTLESYLTDKNDKKASKVRVLDPACGTGAFLLPVYHFLLKKLSDVDGKKILKNNIFGVDKDGKALKYARLLLFELACKNNPGTVELSELVRNIKHGDSLVDSKEVAGSSAFIWEKEFGTKGFDVIVGNPPWGANVEKYSPWLKKRYPGSTRVYIDTYKLFIDRSLSLLNQGGYMGFVVPNSFIFQPAYKDIKSILDKYKYMVIDLGQGIFKGVHLPAAILLLKKETAADDNLRLNLIDLKEEKRNKIPELLFYLDIDIKKSYDKCLSDKLPKENKSHHKFEDVFSLKDAGVQYARVGVGKEGKGKGDLPKRIFRAQKDSVYNIPLLKGSNIRKDGWYIYTETDTWMREDPENVLKENEWVRYNKDIFQREDKIVWRQTADRIIAAKMDFQGYFGKSIQAAVPRGEYIESINMDYVLAVFNSRYINKLYQNKIKEKGRVFPQVKLEYLKSLPFVIPPLSIQEEISALVKNLKNYILEVDNKIKEKGSTLDASVEELGVFISEIEIEIDTIIDSIYCR